MTEEDTFNALCRTPYDSLPVLDRPKVIQNWLEILKSHGWTYEEYIAELVKRHTDRWKTLTKRPKTIQSEG